jgi:transcription elongation factor/antiterminator RfaH
MKYWCAVRTKLRCEAFAEANLQRLGVEVFLPMLRDGKQMSAAHRKSAPLFPGYLFVRCEMPEKYRAVSYAAGVKNIVSFGAGPSIVDDSIIDSIKGQAVNGVIEIADETFVPGKAVRIHEGPLFGLDAVFEKKLSGTHRAVLLLKAISYQARVIIDLRQVANF